MCTSRDPKWGPDPQVGERGKVGPPPNLYSQPVLPVCPPSPSSQSVLPVYTPSPSSLSILPVYRRSFGRSLLRELPSLVWERKHRIKLEQTARGRHHDELLYKAPPRI